jgi:hypothetical protein
MAQSPADTRNDSHGTWKLTESCPFGGRYGGWPEKAVDSKHCAAFAVDHPQPV